MKYVIASVIILSALILDLFFGGGWDDGTPENQIVVNADCIETMGCSGDTVLVPVMIGSGGGYGGSHSVLDEAMVNDHNDYAPE